MKLCTPPATRRDEPHGKAGKPCRVGCVRPQGKAGFLVLKQCLSSWELLRVVARDTTLPKQAVYTAGVACVRVCACVCVRVCVRACVCACVCVCAWSGWDGADQSESLEVRSFLTAAISAASAFSTNSRSFRPAGERGVRPHGKAGALVLKQGLSSSEPLRCGRRRWASGSETAAAACGGRRVARCRVKRAAVGSDAGLPGSAWNRPQRLADSEGAWVDRRGLMGRGMPRRRLSTTHTAMHGAVGSDAGLSTGGSARVAQCDAIEKGHSTRAKGSTLSRVVSMRCY